MKEEYTSLINKAERYLKSAILLLNDNDFDSCVSRCYYAIFYLAEALLFSKGIAPLSHKGIIIKFSEVFIKSGIFEKNIGKILSDAFNLRQVGDYATGFDISKEEALNLYKNTIYFADILIKYIKENLND